MSTLQDLIQNIFRNKNKDEIIQDLRQMLQQSEQEKDRLIDRFRSKLERMGIKMQIETQTLKDEIGKLNDILKEPKKVFPEWNVLKGVQNISSVCWAQN